MNPPKDSGHMITNKFSDPKGDTGHYMNTLTGAGQISPLSNQLSAIWPT